MSTHVDGAAPSVAPDPDDDEPQDDASADSDLGAEWVRTEMQRRMAANRSTRGRHARGGVVAAASAEGEGPAATDGGRVRPRSRPDLALPAKSPAPAPASAPAQHPAAGHSLPAQPPQPPPSWTAGYVSPADLPENYVPRHSVQTPGPAADPAAPISGPIPIVRPVADGEPTGPATGAGGPVGGPAARGAAGAPSLSPAGLPMRRRRGSGPGIPSQPEGAGTAGPWSRPEPIVPLEPTRRLGAPPERLGAPEPIPSWGLPLSSPPRGFARPVFPPDAEAPESGDPTGDAPVGDAAVAGDTVAEDRVAGDTVDGDAGAGPDVEATDPTGSAVGPAVDRAPAVAPAPPAVAPTTPTAAASSPSAPTAPAAPPAPAPATAVTGVGSPPETPAETPPATSAETSTDTSAETTGEITGEIVDLPTAPHPIVLAPRTLSGRLVMVPAQRSGEQARTVTPRPLTPRQIPVVGNAPIEPGSTRVRVVLSERKGVARAVRTIKEVQEGTAIGDLLRRNLIRSQLKVTLRFALLTALVLGALPAVFTLLPAVSDVHVLGLRLPWVLLGVLMYPFLVGVAWRYARVADRIEQNFADHVQD